MAEDRECLNKKARLKSSLLIDRVFKLGDRRRGKYYTAIAVTGLSSESRLGVIVGKRVGPAVTRILVKRRVREFFRRNRKILDRPMDVVVIAGPKAGALDHHQTTEELKELLNCFVKSPSD